MEFATIVSDLIDDLRFRFSVDKRGFEGVREFVADVPLRLLRCTTNVSLIVDVMIEMFGCFSECGNGGLRGVVSMSGSATLEVFGEIVESRFVSLPPDRLESLECSDDLSLDREPTSWVALVRLNLSNDVPDLVPKGRVLQASVVEKPSSRGIVSVIAVSTGQGDKHR